MKTFDEGYYKDRVNSLTFTRSMGMRLLSARDGKSVVECRGRTNLKNLSGMFHGGVMGTLVEVSIAAALRSLISPFIRLMTIEHSVTFLKPVLEGKVTAHATILRLGKAITMGTAEIRNAKGEAVAFGSATISLNKHRVKAASSPSVENIP